MNDAAANIALVRRFVAAWSNLDVQELGSYFTEDGIYHNMPGPPVAGRENVRRLIAGFIKDWKATDWDILTIMGAGDVVICERLDRIKAKNRDIDLPCCGVFLIADGHIREWRDYFDMGTYVRNMHG